MKKKLLSVALSFILVVLSIPIISISSFAEGSCGENLTWSIDGNTLTIEGTGAMNNYSTPPWSSYSSTVTKIVVKEGVTTIGEYAFSYMNNVTEISLPNTLETIKANAFNNVTALTNIILPNGLKTIERRAFFHCPKIESISLPDSVETLGNEVFYNMSALKTVYFGKSLKELGTNIFYSCSNIETINISSENPYYYFENGMLLSKDKTVVYFCFRNKTGAVELPSTVKTVEDYAFSGCEKITSVKMNEGLQKIGAYAFECCYGLTSVTIPDSVTTIGDNAFYMVGNGKLQSVTIGKGVKKIGRAAFYMCHKLETVIFNAGSVLDEIGSNCFSSCPLIKTITLPNSVTTIGDYAFQGDSALAEIKMGVNINYIGASAFDGTPFGASLIENSKGDFVILNNNILYKYKGADTDVVIPEGIVQINNNVFSSCETKENIENIVVPYTLTNLSSTLFTGLKGLKNITVDDWSDDYYDIDGVLFDCNDALICYPQGRTQEEYYIPDGTKTLKENCFLNCPNLKTLSIPKSVIVAEKSSVCRLEKLEKIFLPFESESNIPDTYAGKSAGSDSWFEYVCRYKIYYTKFVNNDVYWEIKDGTLYITGNGAADYSSLNPPWYAFNSAITNVVIDDTVTSVNRYALEETTWFANQEDIITFSNGKRLYKYKGSSDITVDTDVTELMSYCFFDCSGISITIGDNVTKINSNAFPYNYNGCTVRCYKDSYVDEYCEANSITHEHIDTPPLGCVTGSIELTMLDVLTLFKGVATDNTDLFFCKNVADVNSDGNITLIDAMIVLLQINSEHS